MDKNLKKNTSKLLSYVLRHNPESIGVKMDDNGWVGVSDLLSCIKKKHKEVTEEQLDEVVETNEKNRFSFNDDKTKIRANQGHSIDIDLELKPVTPPELLYHGTVEKFMKAIWLSGLKKMNRQHVHLSEDIKTAENVGSRRGKPIVLRIWAAEMKQDGHTFYQSKNGVWLTEDVPHVYIRHLWDD